MALLCSLFIFEITLQLCTHRFLGHNIMLRNHPYSYVHSVDKVHFSRSPLLTTEKPPARMSALEAVDGLGMLQQALISLARVTISPASLSS